MSVPVSSVADILLANPKRTKKILGDGETRIINAPSASSFNGSLTKNIVLSVCHKADYATGSEQNHGAQTVAVPQTP